MAAFHNCANLFPGDRIFSPSHPIHQLSQKEQPTPNAHQELLSSVTRIVTKCPPAQSPPTGNWELMGLHKGPTSAAYLFLQLSELYPNELLQGKSFSEWCLAYLAASKGSASTHTISAANCGITNEPLSHLCTEAVATHDSALALKLCSYGPEIAAHTPNECDEWMFGRTGYMYLLRRIRAAFSSDDEVQRQVQTTIDAVVEASTNAPRPWKWRGKEFIGAAHGALGIVAQIVLCSPAVAPHFQDVLSKMLTYQLPTGNFPISPIKPDEDIYVQYCHGSPGAAIALLALRPFYPDLQAQIGAALKETTRDIWERGLLVKEPCLCHGISGNALGLIEDKEKFNYFVSCTTERVLNEVWAKDLDDQKGDEVCSLYWGEAGRAWVWAVVENDMKGGCIGFDDV